MNTIRNNYLNKIENDYQKMSQLVLQQIGLITEQIQGNVTAENTAIIIQNESDIDHLEVVIREEIINSIVLQTPRAGDLRKLISYFDIIGNLERMGDLIMSIQRRIHFVVRHSQTYSSFQNEMIEMMQVAHKMVDNALFAFSCENSKVARYVITMDENVDSYYRNMHKKIFSFQEVEKVPNALPDLMDISRMVYSIERIGDQATNIAEAVVFSKEGIDIKHQNEKE